MQPHPHSSRDARAPWAADDAKPKERAKAKQAAAKKKPAAALQSRQQGDAAEPLAGPYAWIRRDPSIAQYYGQHVALHPVRGGASPSLRLNLR